MANYFLDASALVKYYHTETGSAEVNRFIHELNARHYISRLITVEVTSAFRRLRLAQGNSTSVILPPCCGAFSGTSPNVSSRCYRSKRAL